MVGSDGERLKRTGFGKRSFRLRISSVEGGSKENPVGVYSESICLNKQTWTE